MKISDFKFQVFHLWRICRRQAVILLTGVSCTASAETLVGSLPGDVNVDNTGEATYSIPLSLPPGTAGMAPTLGLAYSSTGGNGLLGLGFSLNGLSGVSRSPSTRLHDGVIDGVDFDDLDRLVLDGQRLMLVSTGSYGSAESEYRTEIESFRKITLHGGMNAPGSWLEVRTKSGLIYEYGHTADSFVEPEGRTNALRWAVNKISDTAGNYIAFHYSENANEPHLLTNIVYTGNVGQSLSPCNSISFLYETRDDIRSGYIVGSKMVSNKRLQKIEINGASGYITDYRFVYEYNEAGMSLLASVQQFFGGDDIPKTVFSYDPQANAALFQIISPAGTDPVLGGDAYQDWLRADPGVNILPGDFNGDGRTDFLRQETGGWDDDTVASFAVFFSKGDGSFDIVYPEGTNYQTNLRSDPGVNLILGDYNGDGLMDFIRQEKNGLDDNTTGTFSVYFSRGDGYFDIVYPTGTDPVLGGDAYQDWLRADPGVNIIPADYNGDGRTDFIRQEKGGWDNDVVGSFAVFFSKGDGTFDIVYPSGTEYQSDLRADPGVNILPGDFNGDGLSDFIRQEKGDWDNDTITSFAVYFSKGDGTFDIVYPAGTEYQDHLRGDPGVNLILGDYNGDGMTDFICQEKSGADDDFVGSFFVYFSKGNGYFDIVYPNETNPPVAGDAYQDYLRSDPGANIIPGDFNADGLTDFLRQENGGWDDDTITSFAVYFSKGDGTFNIIYPDGSEYQDALRNDPGANLILGDYNGDGVMDFIRQEHSGWDDNTQDSFKIYQTVAPAGRRLTKITKGYRSASAHGPVTEIQYLPITDDLIYTKGTGAVYPVYDIQAPIYVVSALSKDNGIGGKYYSDFTYAEARTHRDRGFLGFRVFESYDNQTHLSQVEILAQDFPQTGSSLRQETYYFADPVNYPTNKQLLKEVSNTYLYDRVNHGGTATNYSIFSYVAKSVEKKWELDQTNTPMTEVASYNWFDNQSLAGDTPVLTQPTNTPGNITYGSITKIVMDYGNGAKQISSNSYFMGGINNWLLGRLATSSVTHVLSGKPSITRTSCFDYDATSGLLRREIVLPGHSTLELTTDYAYDGFGNITNKIVSAPGIVTRSVQQSDYAAGGRFVSASRNILNHGETYQYDQNTGLVTAKTGPNGLTTSMQYDLLGRAVRETRADGTVTTTEYVWLDNTTVSMPDPLHSGSNFTSKVSYRVTTQSSGSAPVTAWYDNQGRELRKIGLSPAGKKVYQDTGYNGLGQPVVSSEPYFPGEEIKYTHSEYDVLGRARYLVSPNGTVMETVYNGLTTQSIADSNHRTTGETPKHQVKTVIQNARGQTLEVIDNLTNSLLYEYDAVGNLTATEDPYGNRIEMEYDLLGKKITQTDPDMGVWHYDYNALGELVSQTDANSNRVENAYDTLGRIVARTNWVMTVTNGLQLESTSAWYYDGTDAGCWLGALRREELRDGQGNLTYRKTYAYDSYGRPMLELYNFDNKWYYNCVRYDQYSRVKFTDRFWRPKAVVESGDNLSPLWNVLSTVNTYNNLGVVTKVSDSTGHTWWQIDDRDVDSKGRLLKYTLGNGTVTTKDYDENTGFLTAIKCRNAASSSDDIQSQLYTFDRLGNITSRRDLRQVYLKETFVNDGLNRLTSSTVKSSTTNSVTTALTYDNQGNILTKTGVGDYSYGQGGAKPHAVTSVSSVSSVVNYSYDFNGNMLGRQTDGTNTLTTLWTSFNMVKSIYSGQNGSTFTYDINNSRITQIIETDTGLAKTVKKKIYIGGMEQDEEVTNPDDGRESWQWDHKETRIFINTPSGTVGIHVQTPGSAPSAPDSIARKYFHTDHLGSIVAVTGERVGGSASILAEYSFDAWGKRRDASTWEPITVNSELITGLQTDRGFTGHEMLDHLGLVHMNGRIYDANLGRFLSADPTFQYPSNLQDYNRYSYVGNNPLRYTDPSGYGWFSGIGKFFKKYWKVIVVIVIAVVAFYAMAAFMVGALGGSMAGGLTAGLAGLGYGAIAACAVAGAVSGFAAGFAGSLLNGGSLSDAFNAGLEGAVSGAITGAVGGYAQAVKWTIYCTSLAMGVTGSAISLAQGDSYQAGFVSGFAGGFAGAKFGTIGRVFAGAIVGGTASVIGGGKFESGAVTGAFAALAASLVNPESRQQAWSDVKGAVKWAIGENYGKAWLHPLQAVKMATRQTGEALENLFKSGVNPQINDNKYGHAVQSSYLQKAFGAIGAPMISAGGLVYEAFHFFSPGHVQGVAGMYTREAPFFGMTDGQHPANWVWDTPGDVLGNTVGQINALLGLDFLVANKISLAIPGPDYTKSSWTELARPGYSY